MLPLYLLTWVIVLLGAYLCIARPGLGRLFAGFSYLLAAGGVNLSLLGVNAGVYAVFLSGARAPVYRAINAATFAVNPTFYVILLVIFLAVLGLLILAGGAVTQLGLLCSSLFLIGLAPIDALMYPWLLLAGAQLYLLTRRFDGLWFSASRYPVSEAG